jgi:hypothetical protein
MNDAPHVASIEHHTTLEPEPAAESGRDGLIRGVATVGVIGVGVALIEAALIPGMVIGVAAVVATKYLPQIGTGLQPMFRSTVRNLYKFNRKTREAVAEAQEKVRDIVAEVHAENAVPSVEPVSPPHA